jgi:cytochrome c biogenesis protein CcmG, thiol:disulfide interchange protein DsbE
MKRSVIAALIAAPVVLLLAVFARGFGSNPHEVPFMLRGKPASAFTLQDLETRETVTLDRFKGRPLVVNFWASYCGPCKMEHPVLEWAYREYGEHAQFVGVVFEDTEENARTFLGAQPSSFPQLLDAHSRMAVDYGVAGVPETYFIDANGIIRDKHVGAIDPQSMVAQLRRLSEPMSAQQGAQR